MSNPVPTPLDPRLVGAIVVLQIAAANEYIDQTQFARLISLIAKAHNRKFDKRAEDYPEIVEYNDLLCRAAEEHKLGHITKDQ
jgi:hypothetical protein